MIDIDQLKKDMSGQLGELLTNPSGAVSDAMSKISEIDVSGKVSQLTSSVSDSLGSVMDKISEGGAGAGDIASTFKSATDKFSNVTQNVDKLSSITSELEKGTKESLSKLESLTSDTSGAITEAVAFVAKPIEDTIKSTTSTLQGTVDEIVDKFDDTLSDLSKSVDKILETPEQIMDAVSEVTNELSSKLDDAKQMLDDVVQDAQDLTNNITDSITGAISGVGDSVKDIAGDLTDTITDIDILPDEWKDKISNLSDEYVSGFVDGFIEDKLSCITDLSKQFGDSLDLDSILSSVFNTGGGSYPGLSDSSGNDLSSTVGDNSSDLVNKAYDAASKVCPNVTKPEVINFTGSKDTYDALLGIVTQLGMADLVEQMANCPSETGLYDSRTEQTLRNNTSTVATNGDINTYAVLQNTIGSVNYNDPITEMKVLAANMKDTNDNISKYNDVLSGFGLQVDDLICEQVGNYKVYDATTTTFMSANGTGIIDNAVGSDNRKLFSHALAITT